MNLIEADKWLMEYEDGGALMSYILVTPNTWKTRVEAQKFFKESFGFNPMNCLCTGNSRIRQ